VVTKISYTEIEATKATSAINSQRGKKKGNEQSKNKNLINFSFTFLPDRAT
jgi:hypothetical protein